ncbi:hypothetical protein E2562_034060 [Oryza meyeriana var. granulata]|uniref:Protein NDH-DEPENDENT CYCLIC ELECTRON FLOW 5 n=1 Tax=Oryza meyeriana var. granulata TaxID=110450 RepID=A0A6G1DSF1_9ORYZ|nr:hypothetical protein E2562_034060 [Oryza meyeriana var. granulata]
MAFCTPTATTHATPTPLTSSWKQVAFCNYSSRLTAGGGQRARLAGASLEVHALAPATAADAVAPSPPNVDYLAAEFAGHGVSFEAVGGSCAVKMEVRNGSAAHLLLPSGLVTSYKPAMWHGAPTEVLHTTVAEGPGGRAVIRGGVSMDLRCAAGDVMPPWSPSDSWSLRDVRGNPTGSIEIELVASAAPEESGGVEARCVVTLHPEALATELMVRNAATASSPPVALSAAVPTHLRVSTPDATYAVGLQGSDYRTMDPTLSEFAIVPPEFMSRSSPAATFPQRWAAKGFDAVLSAGGGRHGSAAEEPDGEEDDDYKQMTAEMCRIYSHAPRQFTIIDRGRRNSICVQRRGFEEVYVFSPGSMYQWYGKYAYVCVGPTTLEPILLGPGATWSGAQYLRNPNL